ncbi:uncharacterized protein C12orf56 homolog [Polymixia lowei]
MAQAGPGNLLCLRNSKLDSFLKRNTDRALYERIRAYEPCVVISESVNKVYMHVVLSDERVYLAEYPPRTLTAAVDFSHIRDIELVNDLPDFLSGKDRERSQHIRVIYTTTKPAGTRDWQRRDKKEGLLAVALPSHSNHQLGEEEVGVLRTTRSASCPNPETLGLLRLPRSSTRSSPRSSPQSPSPAFSLRSPVSALLSPTSTLSPPDQSPKTPEAGQPPRRRGSILARLLKMERASGGERDGEEGERGAELHLYAVSHMSRIYLHLQSSWNSYIIRSTLMLDPLYRRRSSSSPNKRRPSISWERTAHLFRQLSAEVLQEDLSLESLYLLLQELRTAAHRNTTLRKLFWRSSDMCVFLVQTLEDSLHGCQSPEPGSKEVQAADRLLLCTLIAQTLAVMFRETEVEPARLIVLTAKKGALTVKLLLATVCDPEIHNQGSTAPHSELQTLLAEYMDAACSLLFELVLLGQEASRCSSMEIFLTVGWILRVLEPHPHLLSFIGYQAQQVVSVFSDPEQPVLTPGQSVLLFQRCRVLLACLQHSRHLGQYLQSHFREEFRYYVKLSCAMERLPSHYPISQPAQQLVKQLLALILQR